MSFYIDFLQIYNDEKYQQLKKLKHFLMNKHNYFKKLGDYLGADKDLGGPSL
ncbi:hypothetical protein [Colwellia sp. PAMC 21821]|uniref:hypothetical protein n=1 Tax=Colwellia sp. PAMC 21821 TaxID=1816219 RepID=UPI0012DDE261|nr:hypothetical protein [Colwellia sp. PAMC 21821]